MVAHRNRTRKSPEPATISCLNLMCLRRFRCGVFIWPQAFSYISKNSNKPRVKNDGGHQRGSSQVSVQSLQAKHLAGWLHSKRGHPSATAHLVTMWCTVLLWRRMRGCSLSTNMSSARMKRQSGANASPLVETKPPVIIFRVSDGR